MSTELSTKPETCSNDRQSSTHFRRPNYELNDLEKVYQLQVFVPGSNKENISIRYEDDALTIEASRSSQSAADWKSLRREIQENDYRLKLNVNVDIDSEGISAKTEDGVLTIALPKTEASLPKHINIE